MGGVEEFMDDKQVTETIAMIESRTSMFGLSPWGFRFSIVLIRISGSRKSLQ